MLLLDLCLWEKLMECAVGTEDLKKQFEKQCRECAPENCRHCSPCCAGLAVPAALAACSSLVPALFIYKMHYLPA